MATDDGDTLGIGSNLVLGPILINDSYSLLSITVPVMDNYSDTNILGWITVVRDTRLIQRVLYDNTGLGKTGITTVIAPAGSDNLFSHTGGPASQREVQHILPLQQSSTNTKCLSCTTDNKLYFAASSFPAVESAITAGFHGTREVGSLLSTHNEYGQSVSVSYATVPTELVDWIVLVEQSTSEFWSPVIKLRTIILACFFSVLGFFFLASLPLSHWAVRPITSLRAATESTIDPLHRSSSGSLSQVNDDRVLQEPPTNTPKRSMLAATLFWWRGKDRTTSTVDRQEKRFRIPSKVDTSRHWVQDDLSDLMNTFNEMSDELFLQYSKLEDRVQQRTIELEQSKKAAEAANESKTLFVANVSHELKTPLNGILGMCATSVEDDDIERMRTSLNVIYKSGDLLLRTLNDLLTFSTNQVGSRRLALEEREFTFLDLDSQVLTIFEKQATDKNISLCFQCEDASADQDDTLPGPKEPGLRDMTFWGDVHRILQILINLVSNSIKYTPENGYVTVTVRRSADAAPRHPSIWREHSSMQSLRSRKSHSTRTGRSHIGATANFINPTDGNQLQEKSLAPPGNGLYLEFEVQDTGAGIPEELQNRIFEPFVQGESGLDRRYSGTGLGLSICHQLATLMGGNIVLRRSTVGAGSTFNVKLPLRQMPSTPMTNRSLDIPRRPSLPSFSIEPEKVDGSAPDKGTNGSTGQVVVLSDVSQLTLETPKRDSSLEDTPGSPTESNDISKLSVVPTQPATTPDELTALTSFPKATKKSRKESKEDSSAAQCDFSKLRVLVAEDNKVNQQVILRMLKMEQILQVTIAEDGQEALDRVKEALESDAVDHQPYDLIFMDIQMPNMDGLTSTRLIRKSGWKGHIVALTAYAEQKNVDDCLEAGMNHFLAKPLRKQQLHGALTKLCSQSVESVDCEETTLSCSGNATHPALKHSQTT